MWYLHFVAHGELLGYPHGFLSQLHDTIEKIEKGVR